MEHPEYGEVIEIWQPRYKDKKVLIATHKVANGKNYLTFTKDNRLKGIIFEFDGDEVRKCPTQANGRGTVYIYPFSKLRRMS